MKKIFFMIMILFFTIQLLYPQATTGKGKMKGIVTDMGTGEPIKGVTVKLYSLKSKAFHKPFPITDKNGKWKALYVRLGSWKIDFEKAGYETKKISYNIRFSVGAKIPVIETQLKKVEGSSLEANVLKEVQDATMLITENKIDEAIQKFLEIKKKYKESIGISIVDLYIGNCYSKKEEYQKAIEMYKKAYETYPKNLELIISIGNAYSNLNDVENAMKWFNKISFEELNNIDTLYNIGVSFYNKQKYNQATKYFKRAVELDPNFAEGYYQLGMTYTALNKIPETIAALKKFMELDPESPKVETAKAIIEAFSK